MGTRRRNLHRPFDVFLPFHVREVVLVVVQTVVEGAGHVNARGFDGRALVEKVNDLLDVGCPQNIDALHDGSFPGVLDGQNQPLFLVPPRLQGDGQRAAHGLQRTVQRQLPHNVVVFQLRRSRNLFGSGQDADGQGPMASVKSYAEPSLRMSAGAMFTTIFRPGIL